MRKNRILAVIASAVLAVSGCDGIHAVDVYTVAVDPYIPVNEEDPRTDECSINFGDEVSVNGQGAWYKGCDIVISKGGIYKISGTYDKGCISVSTDDTVKLIFANANISNPDGYAVTSDSDRLILASDGTSSISGSGGNYENAVYSNGEMLIVGSGVMSIDGGILSKNGIRFGRGVATFCEIVHNDDGYMIPGMLLIN